MINNKRLTFRQASVAGSFYPKDPIQLKKTLTSLLNANEDLNIDFPTPVKAIIAPHAGYIYSGPVAAKAYSLVSTYIKRKNKITIIGPSHFVPFNGIALSSAEFFETPLGKIKVDHHAYKLINRIPEVIYLDKAHDREHSIEVHLPFIQYLKKDVRIIPLAVGQTSYQKVAKVLEKLCEEEDNLIIISSDLSHYHTYKYAQKYDLQTALNIENHKCSQLGPDEACGYLPIAGLLKMAKDHKYKIKRIDLCNSGDTSGSKDSVVGYGTWIFHK